MPLIKYGRYSRGRASSQRPAERGTRIEIVVDALKLTEYVVDVCGRLDKNPRMLGMLKMAKMLRIVKRLKTARKLREDREDIEDVKDVGDVG